MPLTVREEEIQYVVFIESRTTGERHYSHPVSLDEALSIMQWNEQVSRIRQWIVRLPDLTELNLNMEE